MPRLPSFLIMAGYGPVVNAGEPVVVRFTGDRRWSRYNSAMNLRAPRLRLCISMLVVITGLTAACTMSGEHPARSFADATGGEGLERVFWKEIAARNWTEIERVLASNYMGTAPGGMMDRAAALDQYRTWQLKDYSLGDLKTEMNGSTFVVTYTITLNGNAGAQPLPTGPQHMMSVWQRQKEGWVEIAHSVSLP